VNQTSQIGGAFAPGDRFGPWEVVRRVGAGSTAIVYLATNPALPGNWALKVIHPTIAGSPDFQQRFHRSAQALQPIKHPGLPEIHSWGEKEGRLFLVESFIDGLQLLDPQICPVSWSEVRSLMRGTTVIVDAIHQHKIIHRDIKPANLLVRADGSVGHQSDQGRDEENPHGNPEG
jgi:serine/threonine-protein kinase